MWRILALPVLLAGTLHAVGATAAPCVGALYDRPFPEATGVETLVSDVPTPLFPGLWQQGQIQGFSYRIFANGDALLRPPEGSAGTWSVALLCDLTAKNCKQTIEGTPPAPARRILTLMELCLIAPEEMAPLKPEPSPELSSSPASSSDARPAPDAEPNTDPPREGWALVQPDLADNTPSIPPTEPPSLPPARERPDPTLSPLPIPPHVAKAPPAPDAAEERESEAASPGNSLAESPTVAAPALAPTTPTPEAPDAAPSASAPPPAALCGLATLPDGPPGLTLQRLVVAAGEDPGPLDGLVGRRTRAALARILSPGEAYLPVAEAIRTLDVYLCGP